MFGYIRIAKPELKVKEYEMYKAVYCSLCKNLGKHYSIFSRFTLSYDFTFLALLNMSLKEGCNEVERKRCAFNPLKKCNYCKDEVSLNLPSASAMIMLYYKIKDNIADEKGFKKIRNYFLLPIFSLTHKKAKKQFPEIEKIVLEYINKQNILENNNCNNLDEIAHPTSEALSKIFSLCSENEAQKRILERLGYCLGRYIYILDAACDLLDDIKYKNYNVFINDYADNYNEYIDKRVLPQLYFCVNESAKAFELLDIKKYKNILGNILYLGLEETFKKELNI